MRKLLVLLFALLIISSAVLAKEESEYDDEDEDENEESVEEEPGYDESEDVCDDCEEPEEFATTAQTEATPSEVHLDEFTLPGFESSTWDNNIIPYTIDPKFEPYEKKRIDDAISALNTQAICINFRPKQEDDDNYLSFIRDDAKCMSQFIGFAEVGEQPVYLAPNCSTARYIYWVLLQALGLPAEHMRPDRDNYIAIKWENVEPSQRDAFKKYAFIHPRIARLEYDFESRLHYGEDKFSTERGRKTIVALDYPTRILGNPLSPTFLDYKKVAALYCKNGDQVNPGPLILPEPGDEVTEPTQNFPGARPITKRPPRVNAPPAIVAGLAPLLEPVKVNRNVSDKCICFDRPDSKGSCDGRDGFQFKGMYEQCRRSSRAEICKCENVLLNPCWCEPSVGNCKGSRCPFIACVKKCRSYN